jgi:hypothetical protein
MGLREQLLREPEGGQQPACAGAADAGRLRQAQPRGEFVALHARAGWVSAG